MFYENAPALVDHLAAGMKAHAILPEIEIFDLSHLHGMRRLMDAGLINTRPHVQFVMGIKNGLPAQAHLLDWLLEELKCLAPQATYVAAGIGRHQKDVIRWVLQRQGDAVRTGLEDNVRIDRDTLASSNAEPYALRSISAPNMAPARQGRRKPEACLDCRQWRNPRQGRTA